LRWCRCWCWCCRGNQTPRVLIDRGWTKPLHSCGFFHGSRDHISDRSTTTGLVSGRHPDNRIPIKGCTSSLIFRDARVDRTSIHNGCHRASNDGRAFGVVGLIERCGHVAYPPKTRRIRARSSDVGAGYEGVIPVAAGRAAGACVTTGAPLGWIGASAVAAARMFALLFSDWS
jgi:hypothetical protein